MGGVPLSSSPVLQGFIQARDTFLAALAAGSYTPTVTVGTVTTGAPGSPAQVTPGGTAMARTFNFVLPRGLQGPPADNPTFTPVVTTLSPGAAATVSITGTYPNLNMNIGIPRGDPGTGDMSKAENLSGLANYATARSNLGLGTAALLSSDNDNSLAANSATAAATQQAVKGYVDSKLSGLAWKTPAARAASTTNVNITALAAGSIIDGVTIDSGDTVLLKNQTAPAENGIYLVGMSGPAVRRTDADSIAELVNATIYVAEGTTPNADMQWTCAVNKNGVLGTTALNWTNSGGGGRVLAANNGSDFADTTATFNTLAGVVSTAFGRALNAAVDLTAIIGARLVAIAGLSSVSSKFLFFNSSGSPVVRGLGTGLSDDGTNINAGGGSARQQTIGVYSASLGSSLPAFFKANTAMQVTIEAFVGGLNYALSTSAAPTTFGGTTTIAAGSSATGVAVQAGAFVKLTPTASFANDSYAHITQTA